LPYRLYVPRDYLQSRRYPLLVVLHGAGERGSDNEAHLGNGVLAFCDAALQKKTPAFVVYPQCPVGAQWVETPWDVGHYDQGKVPLSQPLRTLLQLVAALATEFTLDPGRQLLAGLSMGGYGVWDLVTRFPERYAGAVAICGGGDPSQAARAKSVPIWAFHGAADDVVPVAGSRQMVQALKKAGGKVKYTEWAGKGHHIWEKVFADRAVLSWLLTQQRKP
ncbi:MAG TPA: PHB depolymerase family esterase, partial [Polyangia bacterium]